MSGPKVTDKILESVETLGPMASLVVSTLRHQREHIREFTERDGKYEQALRSLQREFDKVLAENARLRSLVGGS